MFTGIANTRHLLDGDMDWVDFLTHDIRENIQTDGYCANFTGVADRAGHYNHKSARVVQFELHHVKHTRC